MAEEVGVGLMVHPPKTRAMGHPPKNQGMEHPNHPMDLAEVKEEEGVEAFLMVYQD